jgi:glucose-6-phosphate 1-dehydrogenase
MQTKAGMEIDNCMLVLFGATGDLTKRKLMPALYSLYARGITRGMPVVCLGRRNLSRGQFIKLLSFNEFIPHADKKLLRGFLKSIRYVQVDLSAQDFSDFRNSVERIDKEYSCKGNRVFYLATPPSLFERITEVLESSSLMKGKGWKRVVYEKPFGYDLRSARKLNKCIRSVFNEKQIYRIDHYLGKELVQNILVLRFANSIFEQIWNNRFIDHVEITLSETVGVEGRGKYYEKAGVIRDMVQNHVLQILSLTAMEPPKSLSAAAIHDEKVRVLKSLQRLSPEELVVGQYGSGVINGKKVAPYIKEPNVAPDSKTATFAALKVFVNTKRWRGVPFYLRTGKSLGASYEEVNLVLKDVSCDLFCKNKGFKGQNVINIKIKPDEGISIMFNSKIPGSMKLHTVRMEFCHKCEFGTNTPAAYEKLLHEIFLGDQTLFTRWDEVEASWKFIDHILKIAKNRTPSLYRARSAGPPEAGELLQKDGHQWVLFESKSREKRG